MNGQPDIHGFSVHFHRQGGFANEIGCMRSGDGDPQYAVIVGIQDDLDETVRVVGGQSPPVGGPGKLAHLDVHSRGLCFVFHEARSGDFRIREDHGRDGSCVVEGLVAGDDFGRDFSFVTRFVSQHHPRGDIADGIYAGNIGFLLLENFLE